MHPITHLLIGWTLANGAGLGKRDRMLVTVAGIIPDLDGLGALADMATEHSIHPTGLYETYHHVLMHNLGSGILVSLAALGLGVRRRLAAALAFLSFHLHLLGDVVGSRGPGGEQWPIPYLWPFYRTWQLTWSHQWGLKAWPNVTLTMMLLALTLYWAWRQGRSPLEMLSGRGDAALARTLRARFGNPNHRPEATNLNLGS